MAAAVFCPDRSRADQERKNLQLDVIINDAPIKMIASFVLFGQNRIGATPKELEEIGLRPGKSINPDEIVWLDDIPTVSYVYQERIQTIQITVGNQYRRGQILDPRGAIAGPSKSSARGLGSSLELRSIGHFGQRSQLFRLQRPFANSRWSGVFALRDLSTIGNRSFRPPAVDRCCQARHLVSLFGSGENDYLRRWRCHQRRPRMVAPGSDRRYPGTKQFFAATRPHHDAASFAGRQRSGSVNR